MDRIFNLVEKEGVAVIEIKGTIGQSYWWDEEDSKDSANNKDLMRKEIEALNSITAKSILLKIDSYGGSVHHGLAMVNALKDTGKPIDVEYIGYSASAATFFGSIANKITLPDNLMVLFHEGQSGAYGTADEILNAANDLEKINDIILNSYVTQSAKAGKNKSKEELKEFIGRAKGQGVWSTADELLELGLITEKRAIYAAVAQVKRPTNEILNKFNLPELPNIIKPNKNQKMGLFDKKLNSFNADDVTAIYEGKLSKGTELSVLNGGELKDGAYEVNGHSVDVVANKVTNYTKIAKKEDAVNIADFKDEVAGVKQTALETASKIKAQGKTIEELKELVTGLTDKISDLIVEGSPIELPKNEHSEGGSPEAYDAIKESRKRIKAKADARREAAKSNID